VQVVQCFQHAAARAALAWLSDSAVLPRQHRLNRSADIRHVLRRGRRFAISAAVVSVVVRSDGAPSRLAVITPKIVGNSVVRHRVARVIRHAFAEFLRDFSTNIDVVVRAQAGSDQLSRVEIEQLLSKAHVKVSV
jgi:ribonuclease P protein component